MKRLRVTRYSDAERVAFMGKVCRGEVPDFAVWTNEYGKYVVCLDQFTKAQFTDTYRQALDLGIENAKATEASHRRISRR